MSPILWFCLGLINQKTPKISMNELMAKEEEDEIISEDRLGGYNKEIPPVDDVCPICFDRFEIPCRSNCGHWFCASCILQFWMFGSSVQPCKCPLCFCRIVNLKPEASQLIQPGDYDAEINVLKKVNQYNALYIGGMLGTFHRIQASTVVLGRVLQVLIEPNSLRCIYYVMRLLGVFFAILYERWDLDFVPKGGLGIQNMFDLGASLLVVILFCMGVACRWILSRRVRHLPRLWDPW